MSCYWYSTKNASTSLPLRSIGEGECTYVVVVVAVVLMSVKQENKSAYGSRARLQLAYAAALRAIRDKGLSPPRRAQGRGALR